MDFEYGIIGGGPAGYTAGVNLAKQGHSVVLFEKDKLGGTCMNKGCIPTKSFLHSALVYSNLKKAAEFGASTDLSNFDFSKVVEKKNQTVEKVRKALELTVKNSGVKTIYSEACIKDKNTIVADGQEYKVGQIIAACGSKPKELKGMEFDGEFILNSDDVLNLNKLPESVLIIGSGAIGTEWARIFSAFDSVVTVVELAEHLIPTADIEVSKRIERIYKQKGIKFYLNDCVEKIENKTVYLKSGAFISPEIILVAVGRVPICPVCEGIKILGDSAGEIQLAHYAINQAKEYTLNIPFEKSLTPSVIYGEPEIAWVGLREQDVDESYTKTTLPITALGKSWCDDATDGFIKLITKDNLIYGAHIVSKEASALIHTLLLAMQQKITLDKLKEMCFAHPTYSEGIFDTICRIT